MNNMGVDKFTNKRHKWVEKELDWLIDNYSNLGPEVCAKKLGLNRTQILNKTNKLGLKINPEIKSQLLSKPPELCNINPNKFYNIQDKSVVYFLGLLWADGHIYQSKNKNVSNISLTMVNEDLSNITNLLDEIGEWNYEKRKMTNPNWKESTNVKTNNKRIYDFLYECDYKFKSKMSADKILSKIDDNLKPYFFRGVVDGDGCFYYYNPNKGSTLRQFYISSSYEQDWGYVEKLYKKLNIKYKVIRQKNKKSAYSTIRITNKNGIITLGDYIYGDVYDNIGLTRKYDKFLLIKNE